MLYTPCTVPSELRTIINSIAVMDADFAASGLPSVYHYPCSVQARLCFYLQGNLLKAQKDYAESYTIFPSFVVGPQLTGVTFDFGPCFLSAVVIFQAGGLFRLTGIPASELLNREVEAELIFGPELRMLEQNLNETFDPEMMGRHIVAYLTRRLFRVKESLPFDHAVNLLVRAHGNMPVERVASHACLSVRQFERKCLERLGLSPKVFARLVRFSKAYQIKEGNPSYTWTRIAHDLGYHDQMHLIRDFKTFAGFAPSVADKSFQASFQLINMLENGL